MWRGHILLLLALAVPPSYSLRTVYLRPGDGQAFAQAVANFGSTREDFTIYLPPGRILSLRNATFVDAVPVDKDYRPFSAGTLTIMPAPTTDPNPGPTILDAGMRYGIAMAGGQPVLFTNTAELHLKNLVVVNLCDQYVPLNSQGTVGWDSATSVGLFLRSRARRSHVYTNAMLYTRQAHLAAQLYIPMSFITPFPQFQALAGKVSADFPRIEGLYKPTLLSAYSFFMQLMNQPSVTVINVTYASTADPQDPVLVSMRAAGALMPPQQCTPDARSLTPLPNLVDPRAPIWMTSDTRTWVDSVRAAVQMNAANSSLLGLPPVVILTGTAAPAVLTNVYPLPVLTGPLLLTGSFADGTKVPEWPAEVDFRASQGTPILPVGPSGDLMIQMMTLQGLPTSPLPGTGTLSAFPFTMFPRAPSSPLISLDQITLTLPDLDYIAVLTLTQQPSARCAWNDTVSRHTQTLAAGITQITPSQPISQGFAEISLAEFRGWGGNATRIRVVPQNMDVLAQISAACASVGDTYKSAAVAGKGMTTGEEIGALVAGCVGSFLVGGLTVWLFAAWRRQKGQGASSTAHAKETHWQASSGDDSDQTYDDNSQTVLCMADKGPGMASECSPQWLRNHHSPAGRLSPTETGSTDDIQQQSQAPPGPSSATQQPLSPRKTEALACLQEPGPLGSTMQLSRLQVRALETRNVQELVSFCDGVAVLPGGGDGAGSSVLLALPVGNSALGLRAVAQAQSAVSQSLGGDSLGLALDTQPADAPAAPDVACRAGNAEGRQAQAPDGMHTDAMQEQDTGLLTPRPAVACRAGNAEGRQAQQGFSDYNSAQEESPENDMDTEGPLLGSAAGASHEQKVGSPKRQPGDTSAADASRDTTWAPAAQHGLQQAGGNAHAGATLTVQDTCTELEASARPLDPIQALTQLLESIPEDKNMIVIKGFLGKGAGGTVYLASWQGMDVALKTMLFEGASGKQAEVGAEKLRIQDQALMEVAVAARVNHPNLVRTYWYELKRAEPAKTGTASGLQIEDNTRQCTETYKLFLIQELCATSLARALQDGVFHQGNQIKEPWTLPLVLLDIARGLQYLHSINIVHGDLKPENILLKICSTSRAGVSCKLADFGLVARLPASATHLSNYTKGTPFYVAPEIISEHKIGRAADIFSFGVIVWQLYSGRTPYMVAGDGSFVWDPAFGHFEPHAMPPPALHQAVVRAFQHDPCTRPTAGELVMVLEQVANQSHSRSSG